MNQFFLKFEPKLVQIQENLKKKLRKILLDLRGAPFDIGGEGQWGMEVKKKNFTHCWDSKQQQQQQQQNKTNFTNLRSKKKKKNSAAELEVVKQKKSNLTQKSSDEMVIFEEKNLNH